VERIRNKTWAEYALWSHNNRDIYFKSGEVFQGAVHANSALYFSGNPVFHGKVTSGTSWYGGSIANVTFHQGFERPVDTEKMADVDFPELEDKADLTYYGQTTIVLVGTNMVVSNSRAGMSNKVVPIPQNGLIYIDDSSSGSSSTRSGDLFSEECSTAASHLRRTAMYTLPATSPTPPTPGWCLRRTTPWD